MQTNFQVIVIGGGHAGTEAALAAARMGATTLLLTQSIETIGQMSCNPAIGGIGKSHLVREVDALGGAMALATDQAGIQFRILNERKGPAVRATRAQADRALYRQAIRQCVEQQPNLFIFQQMVSDLIVEANAVRGVVTQTGLQFRAPSVILTAGTFLGGTIHVGMDSHRGGRAGDPPALALADRLRELPMRVDRLKTGTPPRIDARTVDFSVMQVQPGLDPAPVLSARGSVDLHPRQIPCHITRTTAETHAIIREGFDRSPMFSGKIEGVGPRYCPSIEDKVNRFADRDSHQIFVEPEGLNSYELYPNGISTSLPFDIQVRAVQSIPGFEQAHITRPGYAIEYDFFDPRDLSPSLHCRHLPGLFLAGQINGTTGYEEAAAQGLLAGVNAVLSARGEAPWCPGRDQAYLGVMVDDLVTLGTREPYRMFTSRAEYRLTLREDNADQRLTEAGHQLGLVGEQQWRRFCEKQEGIARGECLLRDIRIPAHSDQSEQAARIVGQAINRDCSLADLLRRPQVDWAKLCQISASLADIPDEVALQIETQVKYAGYISRQQAEIDKLRQHEQTRLPDSLDYAAISGLSTELVQKLTAQRPHSLGQASRIPGMTPAAVSLLLVHLKKVGRLQQKIA